MSHAPEFQPRLPAEPSLGLQLLAESVGLKAMPKYSTKLSADKADRRQAVADRGVSFDQHMAKLSEEQHLQCREVYRSFNFACGIGISHTYLSGRGEGGGGGVLPTLCPNWFA